MPSWVRKPARLRGVLALGEQRQSPLGQRDRVADGALLGLHHAGVPVRRGPGGGRLELLRLGDRLAAHAHGLAGVAPLEVGRGQRDGHLHGLVGGVQRRVGEVLEHVLADVDGPAEVAGLAVAAAQRDAGLDRA